MSSNLHVLSNLMLDDKDHKAKYKYLPGDFLAEVYPDKADRRLQDREMSPKQIIEYRQYLKCIVCKNQCAGTCQHNGD